MKYLILILCLSGCASQQYSGNASSKYEEPTYVRNASGQTIAKIQYGNIYNTSGTRIGSIKSK